MGRPFGVLDIYSLFERCGVVGLKRAQTVCARERRGCGGAAAKFKKGYIMSKRFKWLAPAALSFLCVTGVRAASNQYGAIDLFEGQPVADTNVLVYGESTDFSTWIWNYQHDTTVGKGPFNGQVTDLGYRAPDVAWPVVPANSWWLGATPLADCWGSFFKYAPNNEEWYGGDEFEADTETGEYGTKALVQVYNTQDKPIVDAPKVFILKCAADEGCNMTNGTAAIVAIDNDNYPMTTNKIGRAHV